MLFEYDRDILFAAAWMRRPGKTRKGTVCGCAIVHSKDPVGRTQIADGADDFFPQGSHPEDIVVAVAGADLESAVIEC